MARVISSFIAILLLVITGAYGQKQKRAEKSQGQELLPYSYPFYTIINGVTTPLSGCFIRLKDSTYFVTARHHFYTPVNELRKLSDVMIFVDPRNTRDNARALSLNMKTQRLIPICFDSVCTDIILLPIIIPDEYNINYVDIEHVENLQGKEMAIVGFVQDTSNIIKTKYAGILSRDTTYFLTDKSNTKDQSGSPVLIVSKLKGITKVVLAGIYAGRELSQDDFNKGLVSRAQMINAFFESKKTKPVSSPKSYKNKKKPRN